MTNEIVSPELAALREATMALPEFQAWLLHIERERLGAAAKVAVNEAEQRVDAYNRFIQSEYEASKQEPEKKDMKYTCPECLGTGSSPHPMGLGGLGCVHCGGTGTI